MAGAAAQRFAVLIHRGSTRRALAASATALLAPPYPPATGERCGDEPGVLWPMSHLTESDALPFPSALATVKIMNGGQGDSWQKRYEAGAARDQAGNAAWTRERFGVPLSRTVLQALPGMLALFVIGLLLQGWLWNLISAAVLLAVILIFLAWARRRYGIPTERPTPCT